MPWLRPTRADVLKALALAPASLMAARATRAQSNVPAMRGHLQTGRWAATATRLQDGSILVAGGYSYTDKDTLPSTERLDPITLLSHPASPLLQDRNFATASLLPDGRVLIAGGYSEKHGTRSSAELYDPRSDHWSPTAMPMNDARELFTATTLADNRILLVGGLSLRKRRTLETAELYDPQTGTFTLTHSAMPHDRFGHDAVRLADGRVLIVGGKSWTVGQPDHTVPEAVLYDPANDQFLPAGTLILPRDRPTATLLPDNRVLVAGGTDHGLSPLSAEIWDPKTNRFTSAGLMHEGRMAHAACALSDGRVLVAGGWSDGRKGSTPTVECYDPDGNRWRRLLSLPFTALDLCLVALPGSAGILALSGKSTQDAGKSIFSVAEIVRLPVDTSAS